jgi:hypothetical protein
VEVHADRPVEAMRALDEMAEVEKTSLFGTAVHAVLRSDRIRTDEIAARLRESGLTVTAVDEVVPSLEDVFLDIVDKTGGAAA